jgi:hypothetical protein
MTAVTRESPRRRHFIADDNFRIAVSRIDNSAAICNQGLDYGFRFATGFVADDIEDAGRAEADNRNALAAPRNRTGKKRVRLRKRRTRQHACAGECRKFTPRQTCTHPCSP